MAGSALVHALILFAAIGTLKGAVVAGGGDGGDGPPAITVTLAGLSGGPTAAADPAAAQLQSILRQIQDSELQTDPKIAPAPAPREDLDKLMARIDDEAALSKDGDRGKGRGAIDQGGLGAEAGQVNATSKAKASGPKSLKAGPAGGASSGVLWGLVQPCWRNMPGVSAVPVSLDVTIGPDGMVAAPPVILRAGGAPIEEPRLIAEARAIAAIKACVPYQGALGGLSRQTFRLNFTASNQPRYER